MSDRPPALSKEQKLNALEKIVERVKSVASSDAAAAVSLAGAAIILTPPTAIATGLTGKTIAVLGKVAVSLLTKLIYDTATGKIIPDTEITKLTTEITKKDLAPLLKERDFYDALRQLHTSLHGELLLLRELIQQQIDQRPTPAIACNQVPDPPAHFAGRVDDLDKLKQTLAKADQKAIAVTALRGIGGIGKTTLVQQFAAIDEQYGLKLWARLGEEYGENKEEEVLRRWARMTGQPLAPGMSLGEMRQIAQESIATVAQSACQPPVLLVIDDVWPDTVQIARGLRDAVPRDTDILVTTRREDVASRLNMPCTTLGQLSASEGADLLVNFTNEADRPLAETLRPKMEELSNVLDGHPLALELAARQWRDNPQEGNLDDILDRFQQGMEADTPFADLELDQGEDKVDSVSVSLDLTLNRLGGKDQKLNDRRKAQFRALGVLPPDIPFRAAHLMALWDEEDRKGLNEFVSEGLLDRVEDPDPQATQRHKPDQYQMHRLLRAYARSQLRQVDELGDVNTRHINYLFQLADDAFNNHPPEQWSQFDDDLPQIHSLGNTLAAQLAQFPPEESPEEAEQPGEEIDYGPLDDQDRRLLALSQNPPVEAPEGLLVACEAFAAAVYGYIFLRYIGTEGRRWLWAGLPATRAIDQERRVVLLTDTLGSWHNQRGYKSAALFYHQQSLEVCIALGDRENQAATLNNIGMVYDALGGKAKALEAFEKCQAIEQAIGVDEGSQAITLNNIAGVYYDLGEKEKALEHFRQTLPLFRAVGDRHGEATTLNNIGEVYRSLGENDKALAYYQQALPLRRAVGDRDGEAVTLYNMSFLVDDSAQAIELVQQAFDLWTAVQSPDTQHAAWRLAELRGEAPFKEEQMAAAIAQMVADYKEHGEDYLREKLKSGEIPGEQIDQILNTVRKMAEDDS